MSEAQLKARVMKRLRTFGGYWWKTHGGPYGVSGIADIIGCYKGHFVAIELKAPGRYRSPFDGLTPNQTHFLKQIEMNGGVQIATDDEEWLFEILQAL